MRASFSIPYAKWQQFQQTVRARGSTVSATLLSLIEDYLKQSSSSLGGNYRHGVEEIAELATDFDHLKEKLSQLQSKIRELETNLDDRMEEAVLGRLNSVDRKLNKLQTTVTELNRRQNKFESNAKQTNKSSSHSEDNLIDIEAILIEDEEIDNGKGKVSKSDLFDEVFEVVESFHYQGKNIKDKGITEQVLCQRFGLKPSRIIRNAKLRGLSCPEYLYQVTGWFYRNGKYYSSLENN